MFYDHLTKAGLLLVGNEAKFSSVKSKKSKIPNLMNHLDTVVKSNISSTISM